MIAPLFIPQLVAQAWLGVFLVGFLCSVLLCRRTFTMVLSNESVRREELKGLLISMDVVIEKLMKLGNTPGLSMLVLVEGEVVFQRGYGLASISANVPATSSTIYPIASITKGFVAAACGVLVAEGKLSWGKLVTLLERARKAMLTTSRYSDFCLRTRI